MEFRKNSGIRNEFLEELISAVELCNDAGFNESIALAYVNKRLLEFKDEQLEIGKTFEYKQISVRTYRKILRIVSSREFIEMRLQEYVEYGNIKNKIETIKTLKALKDISSRNLLLETDPVKSEQILNMFERVLRDLTRIDIQLKNIKEM